MKVEEMTRRHNDKERSVAEQTYRLSKVRTSGGSLMRQSIQTNDENCDVNSQFTMQTEESEVALDENVLDFRLEEASFDAVQFSRLPTLDMRREDIER